MIATYGLRPTPLDCPGNLPRAANGDAAEIGPKVGFDSSLGLQRHVFGLAYYAMGIERVWGAARLPELRALQRSVEHGISFS